MLTIIASAVLIAGSVPARGRDPGPPDTRQVSVEKFDQIVVDGTFKVTVTTGKALSVSLSGPRTMLDDTEMRVRDGKLFITWQEGASWSRNGNHGVDVAIAVPGLRGALIGGAGSIDIDRIESDLFEATVPSSGRLRLGSLRVKMLKALLNGSGTLAIDKVEADSINSVIGGSGGMQVAGSTDDLKLVLAGAGSFDNPHFVARDATIFTTMSGKVRATVTGAADITSQGSGSIDLTGGARCAVTKRGSGNVNCS